MCLKDGTRKAEELGEEEDGEREKKKRKGGEARGRGEGKGERERERGKDGEIFSLFCKEKAGHYLKGGKSKETGAGKRIESGRDKDRDLGT